MDPQPQQTMEGIGSGRGLIRAFSHRNFRIFFLGQFVSLVGTWSQMLAVSWLVWRLTGSALWLGFVGFAMQAPMFLLGLFGGAFADRYDRLNLFRLLETLCMVQALILAWLTLTGRVELWHVVALTIGIGIVYAFEFPVRQTLVMDLAGRQDLLNAISLSSAVFHTSRMIGPIAAGIIVERFGEGECFLFNAATFLALLGALFLIDRKTMFKGPGSDSSAPMLHSILEGLKHMWGSRKIRMALAITALMAGIGMQYTTLMPIFADDVFGGGAKELGWLMGASGFGSLGGALWLASRKDSDGLLRLASTCSLIFSAGLIAFSASSSLYPALAVMAVCGSLLAIVFSSMNTFLQHESPDELRGRVLSLWTITFVGFAPFGSLAAGALAGAVGARYTLAIGGLTCLILAGIIANLNRKRASLN